ncbi:MAG TPA: hypothetical protein VNO70_12510 [Blastocatellia bacterium]|nr:hypothetical protein [Blastocatellia bacterium]
MLVLEALYRALTVTGNAGHVKKEAAFMEGRQGTLRRILAVVWILLKMRVSRFPTLRLPLPVALSVGEPTGNSIIGMPAEGLTQVVRNTPAAIL